MKLTFQNLRDKNVPRCEQVFHRLDNWSPTDWACAMAGEAGEACNVAKKMKRLVEGSNTAKDPQSYAEFCVLMAEELADVVIYADLLAARLGIDLGEAIVSKFNKVSDRMGSDIKLER